MPRRTTPGETIRGEGPLLNAVRGRLIVSCQAREGEPFRNPCFQAAFARAAVEGGAAAIRANGEEDIRAIRAAVTVPVIGIRKVAQTDGRRLITPTFDSARKLVEAGAGAIALDVTARGRRFGAIERLKRIRAELKVPAFADIATLDEALEAADAGADAVLSTMRGYTDETADIRGFDPGFIRDLVRHCPAPVIAEGMIETPQQAASALEAGAWAVVVGSAITRPVTIARRFSAALERKYPAIFSREGE
jgi:putative N-acetylmannosamine-6-phosphate epimerase